MTLEGVWHKANKRGKYHFFMDHVDRETSVCGFAMKIGEPAAHPADDEKCRICERVRREGRLGYAV